MASSVNFVFISLSLATFFVSAFCAGETGQTLVAEQQHQTDGISNKNDGLSSGMDWLKLLKKDNDDTGSAENSVVSSSIDFSSPGLSSGMVSLSGSENEHFEVNNFRKISENSAIFKSPTKTDMELSEAALSPRFYINKKQKGEHGESTVTKSGNASPTKLHKHHGIDAGELHKKLEELNVHHLPPLHHGLLNSHVGASIHKILNKNLEPIKEYRTVEKGAKHTTEYRVVFRNFDGQLISPWHDIPLYTTKPRPESEQQKVFNMIVEIPKWSNAKMEIATKEPMNPIKQDEKGGVTRFVDNVFPYRGYLWNYGALPQTWEDPNHLDEETGAIGDNDPIDVVEIGSKVKEVGDVAHVKILGVLAMLDEGETDWKLVAIDVDDELASKLNDIGDVEEHMPGMLSATRDWFRVYKMPAKKPPNKFAYNGEFKDRTFAHKIIDQTHQFWQNLITLTNPDELITQCHQSGAQFPANKSNWEALLKSMPKHGMAKLIPGYVDKTWHFIDREKAEKMAEKVENMAEMAEML